MINVTRSRCVRIRYKGSTCVKCLEICPKKIISISDNGLRIDENKCTYCMLCVSVCPTGALEEKYFNLATSVSRLADIPLPVLGCRRRIGIIAHSKTPCFGFFSTDILILLYLSQQKPIQFNMTECGNCSNKHIIPIFLERITFLTSRIDEIELLPVLNEIDLQYEEKTYNRRNFFGEFKNIIDRNIDELSFERTNVAPRSYGSKYLPRIREMLNQVVKTLPEEKQRLLIEYFYFFIYFTENCNDCTACVGLCPTGAVSPSLIDQGKPFWSTMCTGCMLCTEFCPQNRIRIGMYPSKDTSLEEYQSNRFSQHFCYE